MQPITPASPGQPLRASDINAQSSELRRQGNTFFEGGTLSQEAGGVHFSTDVPTSFFAMITGRDGYNYGFKEVQKAVPQRGWNENDVNIQIKPLRKSSGTGDYAVEVNGSLVVPSGSIVQLVFLTSYYDTENIQHNIYGFNSFSYGGDSVSQQVLTNISASPSGIIQTKHAWASYNADYTFSPTLMANTDVIPKSLAGQKNKVLCVNNAETGFEFGASVVENSGTGVFTTAAAALQTQITNLTTALNTTNARVLSLENRLAAFEASL